MWAEPGARRKSTEALKQGPGQGRFGTDPLKATLLRARPPRRGPHQLTTVQGWLLLRLLIYSHGETGTLRPTHPFRDWTVCPARRGRSSPLGRPDLCRWPRCPGKALVGLQAHALWEGRALPLRPRVHPSHQLPSRIRLSNQPPNHPFGPTGQGWLPELFAPPLAQGREGDRWMTD